MRHVNKTFSLLIEISFHFNSTFALNGTGQFKKYRRSMRKVRVCRFHPTEPVLACSVNGKVILLSADNSSVPFSNWKKKETQLKLENYRRLESIKIEWNVSKLNI
jgi:hypothetical protein